MIPVLLRAYAATYAEQYAVQKVACTHRNAAADVRGGDGGSRSLHIQAS